VKVTNSNQPSIPVAEKRQSLDVLRRHNFPKPRFYRSPRVRFYRAIALPCPVPVDEIPIILQVVVDPPLSPENSNAVETLRVVCEGVAERPRAFDAYLSMPENRRHSLPTRFEFRPSFFVLPADSARPETREGVLETFQHVQRLKDWGVAFESHPGAALPHHRRGGRADAGPSPPGSPSRSGCASASAPSPEDAEGWTTREIGAEMGISAASVCRMLKSHHRPMQPQVML
jgi:hypothetical protein